MDVVAAAYRWLKYFLTMGGLAIVASTSFVMPLVAQTPIVYLLTIDGVINPLSARYLERGLAYATQQEGEALILQLNTPGGLESSMRKMAQSILNARLPVVVFVAPAGGRAASAGMFITLAADVAVMAPGTNIGAAHPVPIGGTKGGSSKDAPQQADPSTDKAVQDAAAFARSLAKLHQRNITWAEDAVLNSISISADEALKKQVIDFIASDIDELLARLAGRNLLKHSQTQVLATAKAKLVALPMNLPERILSAISDPNMAYLFMSLGTVGIIAEFYSPGLIIPGISGLIAILLAFAGLGSLPLNWIGIVLLVSGLLLMLLELYSDGTGALAVLGLLAFTLGSLFLYRPLSPVSPAMPAVHVNHGLIFVITAGMAGFFLFLARAVSKSQAHPVATGKQLLIGKTAITLTDLNPHGIVKLGGEEWSAIAQGAKPDAGIAAGQMVEVVAVEGVRLAVKPKCRTSAPYQQP